MLRKYFEFAIGKEDDYIALGRGTNNGALEKSHCCLRHIYNLEDGMELLTPKRRVAVKVGIFF